jgi:two-component system sensor histidine kinase YesM
VGFFYIFREIEATLQDKIIEKSTLNLTMTRKSFDDVLSILTKAFYIVEKDPTIAAQLQDPSQYSDFKRTRIIEEKLVSLDDSLFLYHSPQVYYTVADFKDNLYVSYMPKKVLNYNDFLQDYGLTNQPGFMPHQWITADNNYVSMDRTNSPNLLTLLGVLLDNNNRPIGYARLSLDYHYWFHSTIQNTDAQIYSIIERTGKTIVSSSSDFKLSPSVIQSLQGVADPEGFFIDRASSTIVLYNYIPSLDWYLINYMSLDLLLSEIYKMKQRYFAIFCVFTVLFTLITFLIASSITRPLQKLNKKMVEVVDQHLEIPLTETQRRGEIQELTRTFNQMIRDMKEMLQKLKMEQLQKEAVRFQMLLSQMNPHFLFNTLNTIKFIALRKSDEDIADICVSLGKLLETSLNSEIELIHLKKEIELLQDYVHIQQFRYQFVCDISYEYSDQYDYALVPKLSLQPLIENAIHHGFYNMKEAAQIVIRVHTDANKLTIEVEDNGRGLNAAPAPTNTLNKGIGLSNLRERLQILFKQEAEILLIPMDKGTRIRLTFPLLLSNPFEKEV